MSDETHTPGPWSLRIEEGHAEVGYREIYVEAGGVDLAIIYGDESVKPWAEDRANARLIAAAPELLEAVAMLVEWWDREESGPQYSDPAGRDGPRGEAEAREWFYGNVNLAGETHKLARAALAKARGDA